MEKHKNKYRNASLRAQWWDYGNNAAYFVTICTQDRIHYFGEIVGTELIPSPLGEIALTIWHEMPNHFPFVLLGAFMAMPNHIHGIVIIDKPVDSRLIANPQQNPQQNPQTHVGGFAGNKNPMLNENLSRAVRWYKGRCTFEMRKIRADFAWQSRFHDRIIRNDAEYQRINDYIENNPAKWGNDKFSQKETI